MRVDLTGVDPIIRDWIIQLLEPAVGASINAAGNGRIDVTLYASGRAVKKVPQIALSPGSSIITHP